MKKTLLAITYLAASSLAHAEPGEISEPFPGDWALGPQFTIEALGECMFVSNLVSERPSPEQVPALFEEFRYQIVPRAGDEDDVFNRCLRVLTDLQNQSDTQPATAEEPAEPSAPKLSQESLVPSVLIDEHEVERNWLHSSWL